MKSMAFSWGQSLLRVTIAFVVLLGTTTASAQVYDFGRFLSGGGGGQDPQKRAMAQSMGAYICLGITQGGDPGTVRFIVWSRIPQRNARIGTVAIDLGRHQGLIHSITLGMVSQGMKPRISQPEMHPFLRSMTPEFWVGVPQAGHLKPEGFAPGRMLTINATLGPGRSINDVILALHEGLNPSTGESGLRFGVIVLYLLGGPPPGVPTINDDGGFVTAGPATNCQ